MSYDLEFDCGELDEPHTLRGGTYALGRTTAPELNMTFNYSPFFYKHLCAEHGLLSLYGMTAEQVMARLDEVLPNMNGEPSGDYWAATEGNAKAALQNLRELAALCPPDSKLEIFS